MIKILNLKLMTLLENQNIDILLHKVSLQIGLKRVLWLKKLKTLRRGHVLWVILTEKKLLERFTKNKCKKKKQIKKILEFKK